MTHNKKPYIDYEDDESVLPLMGTRVIRVAKRDTDRDHFYRRKLRGGRIGHRGLKK